MIAVINIQAFLFLVCGMVYLSAALVIDRDIRRLRNTSYQRYAYMDTASRNRRKAIEMFITTIIMEITYLSSIKGFCQYSDDFLRFIVSANISTMLLVSVDITENVTYLYRYIHYRIPILLIRVTIASFLLTLVLFFYWLPWLAVIIVTIICLCGLYVIYMEWKGQKELES